MVKIKKDDFESLARENGINKLEHFYMSDFFKSNFSIAPEFVNGTESIYIFKEI